MTRQTANKLHAAFCLLLLVAVFCVRWVWAGLVAEYGSRGPGGSYTYDLSSEATANYVNITGVAAGLAAVVLYCGTVWLMRRVAA